MRTILKSTTNQKRPGISKKSTAAAIADTLRHLAFENAAQANIISTVSSGKIIIANSAACQLLGYSKKELLTKNRAAIFDINQSSFKKMLKQRTAEGHSAALVTAIKKSGKSLPCEITSAVFMDEDGIEKAITTIADMGQSILKQKKIDTRKERIVADNIVLAKSKQKKIDTRKERIVADNIVLAKSKQKKIDIIKERIGAGNIVLAKSKQKKIDTKKERIVADNIILAQAKSDARQAENNKWKKYTGKTSYDVMWDWDIATGQIYVGDSIQEMFGYKVQNNTVNFTDFSRCLLPEEKDTVEKKLWKTLASGNKSWNDSFMFKRHDGSVASTTSRATIVRDEEGKALRLIGAIQDISRLQELEKKLEDQISIQEEDISKQKVLEERLGLEIKLKEKQIAEAMEEAKETERSVIGKELHDNVNQLLGASRLYLDMAKQGGESSEMYLTRSSEYTLMAIEEIRKLTKGLTTEIIKNLGICEAIANVSRDTMEVNPVKISWSLESFNEDSVSDKFKLNAFRIVQEQLNNILKHAKATEVTIDLSQNKQSIMLTIADNGIGFDTGKRRKGIGVDNIKSRAASYNGTADFASQPGQGCVLTATFPVTEALLK